MDKERGAEAYDDAIAAGGGAYMLKKVGFDNASCAIGNLPPQAECLVKITYVTELSPEEDKVRFMLPTTIAPLYSGISSINQYTPTSAGAPLSGLSIDLKLNMASTITSISSSTHPLALEFGGRSARIKLGTTVTSLSQNIEILIGTSEPFTPRLWVEPVVNDDIVESYSSMAVFFPSYPILVPPYPKVEFIFVVDQSGSMAGQQIIDAKTALHILLRSIPEGSKFNIVGFGSSFHVMSQESLMYNSLSFETAKRFIDGLDASLGGTNLKQPLQWIFRQRADFNYPRQVFVLTDGQISDTNEVLQMVKLCSGFEIYPTIDQAYSQGTCTYISPTLFTPQHWYQCRTCNMVETLGLCGSCKTTCHSGHDVIGPYFSDFFCDCAVSTTRTCQSINKQGPPNKELYKSSTRVFSLGIGPGVSKQLVKGLAKFGNGTSAFVKTGEKMEQKVVAQLKLSMQPSLTNVSIVWPTTAIQSPSNPPPIFNRSRLIVYATSKEKPSKVTLNAFADYKEPVSVELPVQQIPENDTEFLIRKLVAKARIKDLEEIDNHTQLQKKEIVEVSEKNQILSTLTAFVAIDERKEIVEGTMQMRKLVAPPPIPGFSPFNPALGSTSGSHAFGVPSFSTFATYAPTPSFLFSPSFSAPSFSSATTFSFPAASPSPFQPPSASSFGGSFNLPQPATPTVAAPSNNDRPVGTHPSTWGPPERFSFGPATTTSNPAPLPQSTSTPPLFNPAFSPNSRPSTTPLPAQFMAQLPTVVRQTPEAVLTELMNLQAFNGLWNLDGDLAKAVRITLPQLQASKPTYATDQIWATAIGIAFLELKLHMLIGAWELAAQKSRAQLASSIGILEAAKQAVRTHSTY